MAPLAAPVAQATGPGAARTAVVVSYNHVGRRTLTPEIVKEAMTVFKGVGFSAVAQ